MSKLRNPYAPVSVCKIADYTEVQITEATRNMLFNFGIVYKDRILSEHILDTERTIENGAEMIARADLAGLKVTEELAAIDEALSKAGCAYLRIIDQKRDFSLRPR